MTDRPIIFSAPMVNALLSWRKSMTRRILKPPYGTLEFLGNGNWKPIYTRVFPGDRLWCREGLVCATENMGEFTSFADVVCYAEDGSTALRDYQMVKWPWKRETLNARFMPRWASRLTLIVTDVRVQRLQDISEADAAAEGIEQARSGRFYDPTMSKSAAAHLGGMFYGPRPAFEALWTSIHGPDAWDANPWVAAISFETHKCNIDQMPGGDHE